jgi:CubicO group peptidase (beta-lactamase class C family)
MTETGFSVPTEKQHRLAPICRKNGQGFTVGPLLSPENSVDRIADPVFISGGGGLFSTSHDYCKFALFLLNDGVVRGEGGAVASRLLTAESLLLLRTNHLPEGKTTIAMSYNPALFSELFGEGFGFGLGVYVLLDPAKAPGGKLSGEGEFGWGGLASTFLIVDPVKEMAVVILTSLIPSSSLPLRAQIRWLAHFLAEQEQKEKQEQ